ncbi:TRAP transporter large permease subunit [Allopusillimonas soli]|uniref:TRAP transporter large permease subunit n=1 Tax=Allopusillimonas soli TaxID=659016 RepID=A0A853F7J0_9BURK|nr:TRAP transporter large permease subunit [Allopusillimonas soli]NYT35788.1 TRAP transporter large permease subunit [Allopusillimonas soli]TEA76164.1 TRAP transporter large permease subunit [Allopusillimonas soli]
MVEKEVLEDAPAYGAPAASGATLYPLSDANDFVAIRVMARLVRAGGTLAGLALVAMSLIMCYEIGSRSLFNEPTSWATEISTYLLVAVVFLGLGAAQASNSHVQVELWVDRLAERQRRNVELVSQWCGLLFVTICAWQMVSFNVREYVNDTRDWGLLSTPQWIPELSVSIGLCIYALSLLLDIYRLKPPANNGRRWAVPVFVLAMAATLCLLGRLPMSIAGGRMDWGSVVIVVFLLASMLAWSGLKATLQVSAIMGVMALLFWLARGQSLVLVGALLVAAMMFMLLFGIRIAVALGLAGMFGVYFLLSRPQLSVLAERAWSSTNTFTLSAVPMFIFMGGLLLRSGIVSGMFDSLIRWFGRTPGGLAHASAGASAIFAAVSGSSLATAATLGKVSCPEMIERGYSPRLTYGITGAGATLGILIPPSIPMIIYGTTVGASVTHLFMGGMLPGLLLMGMFMLTALVWAVVWRGSAPAGRAYTMREKLAGSSGMVPFTFIIVVVLGSMYAGIATPTEAAALGALCAFVLCLVKGRISLRSLFDIALDTATVTAMLLLIVVGASIFSWVFDYIRLPREIVGLITDAQLPASLVMACMTLAYLVLGMFIESIAMMLMTLPVTYPIAVALGMDPIWFGIFLVLMIEIGLITPPLGMVLFVLHGMNEKIRFTQIIYGVLPFVVVMLLFLVIIYTFPAIVTWLPGQAG